MFMVVITTNVDMRRNTLRPTTLVTTHLVEIDGISVAAQNLQPRVGRILMRRM